MRKSILPVAAGLLVAFFAAPDRVAAQDEDSLDKFIEIAASYRTASNITYFTANGHENKLDVYMGNARTGGGPNPTVIFYHGGGGVMMSKGRLAPWTSPCFHTSRWAGRWSMSSIGSPAWRMRRPRSRTSGVRCGGSVKTPNSTTSISTAWSSQVRRLGGMFATLAGILPTEAGFDRQCLLVFDGLEADLEPPRVTAVIDWYGVTDVADTIDGPNARTWSTAWVGSQPNRHELARRLSPLTHVRPGLPPILIVHGDQDQQVLHTHAEKMHAALDEAGVPNELFTVVGGGHGQFGYENNVQIWSKIRSFLGDLGLP